jgi:flagellar basal body-associated protein FliL
MKEHTFMEAALNSPLGRTVLGQAPLKIGRAPDNALVISDPQSSAHHAEVAPAFNGSGYQITDLSSTNGTFVNEQRLTPNTPRPLYANDVIRIGTTSFAYEASGAGYAPTVAANAPNYEPTVAAAPGAFTPPPQPAYQQPPVQPAYPQQPAAAYNNMNTPAQPPYTPPPGYPQPQQGYPQSQPVYPQPGGFGQPGYPPAKKSRAGLWIAIIVIVVLLVGGGIFVAYLQLRSTPQKTLASYCDGLKTSNASELYGTLSSASQAKTSVSKIQTGLQALSLIGGIKDCTVNSVTENGSTATGNVTLTLGHGPAQSGNVPLTNENGTWKIDTSSSGLPSQ